MSKVYTAEDVVVGFCYKVGVSFGCGTYYICRVYKVEGLLFFSDLTGNNGKNFRSVTGGQIKGLLIQLANVHKECTVATLDEFKSSWTKNDV